MINIAGVVILYNPDPQVTIDNIRTYFSGVKKLYVYDNSEIAHPDLATLLAQLGDTVSYYFFGSNEGISKRLNDAANAAISDGYDYLLTMDQDSSFTEGAFEQYLKLVEANTVTHVAQFGVNFQKDFTAVNTLPVKVLSLITSGSIINLKLFNQPI